MDNRDIIWTCAVISLLLNGVKSLFIDGCPMYGCRPSGSFSFYIEPPADNASINWVTQIDMDPVPNALGCVSNSAGVICQSNGVFAEDKGYISLLSQNGTLRWRDKLLHFPSLPVLDNLGDITGSDGNKLVHYDQDGTKYPVIPCHDLKPLFNMALVGDSFLLLVSGNGNIVVRQTNGIPVGSLTLNATVNSVKGAFIPIAQPVVNTNEERFYVLTVFTPHQKESTTENQQEVRVYAIDVHHTIDQRITIAWHYSVSTKSVNSKSEEYNASTISNFQSLLFDRVSKELYVIIKPDADKTTTSKEDVATGKLITLNDYGQVVFEMQINALQMTKFVTDHCDSNEKRFKVQNCRKHIGSSNVTAQTLLWLQTTDSVVLGVTFDGEISVRYDLTTLLGGSVEVTSYISTVRNSDDDNDTLILAVGVQKSESAHLQIKYADTNFGASFGYRLQNVTKTFYVIAIDSGKDGNSNPIKWMVPVPNNMRVLGQITGTSGADIQTKDQLIAYAEQPTNSAVIFSIH